MFKALFAVAIAAAATPILAQDVSYKKTFGDWVAFESVDPMTDKKQCSATYVKDKQVLYTSKDAFKISYHGRGGVESYRYRFGKAQASEPESPDANANNWVTVPVFVSEALDAPNLRVQGTTVLKGLISMDISLKGLREARNALAARCGDLFSTLPPANEAPAWARWQILPIADN